MSQSIQNSVAFVSGANRGIGRAIVESLLTRGAAKVYAAARNPDALADLATAHGDKVVPITLDVTDKSQVTAAASTSADATLIINNAGVAANTDIFSDDLSDAEREFEVNYWGTLHMTRAFVPNLKTAGIGSLVNVVSIAGLTNFPMFPTYSDSKAALHSLTVGARHVLSGTGIDVIGVYPGPVETDMAKNIDMPKASTADVANTILDGIESGAEEVFTDEVAKGFEAPYVAGHKALEFGTREMMAQG
ncbi:MAG: SDR family oxidoreductase [Opitutaceae bacterium]|jgi:NAD(P)-dependent dehydrogenase (short-subunit alcohol dehydrogenase family)|nr:SDR family oxidoreductase [Opitutaceae bacterium]